MSARAERNQDTLDRLITAANAALTGAEPRPARNTGLATFADAEAARARLMRLILRDVGRAVGRGETPDYRAVAIAYANEPRFQSHISAAECRRLAAWLEEKARTDWAGPGQVRETFSRKQSRRARIGAELKRDGNPFRDAEAARLRAAGLTLREIAARLRLSLGGVHKVLKRQRGDLARALHQAPARKNPAPRSGEDEEVTP